MENLGETMVKSCNSQGKSQIERMDKKQKYLD